MQIWPTLSSFVLRKSYLWGQLVGYGFALMVRVRGRRFPSVGGRCKVWKASVID